MKLLRLFPLASALATLCRAGVGTSQMENSYGQAEHLQQFSSSDSLSSSSSMESTDTTLGRNSLPRGLAKATRDVYGFIDPLMGRILTLPAGGLMMDGNARMLIGPSKTDGPLLIEVAATETKQVVLRTVDGTKAWNMWVLHSVDIQPTRVFNSKKSMEFMGTIDLTNSDFVDLNNKGAGIVSDVWSVNPFHWDGSEGYFKIKGINESVWLFREMMKLINAKTKGALTFKYPDGLKAQLEYAEKYNKVKPEPFRPISRIHYETWVKDGKGKSVQARKVFVIDPELEKDLTRYYNYKYPLVKPSGYWAPTPYDTKGMVFCYDIY